MEEKKINKRIVFSVVVVLLLIAVVAGATYAFFSAGRSSETQTITTGTVDIGFALGNTISLPTLMPISDSEIKTKAASLPFSITNNGSEHMKVEIKLTDIVLTPDLKDIDFRWGLYNADTDVGLSFGFFKNIGNEKEITIYEDFVIDAGEPAKNYKVRVWIHDDGAEQNYMQGETFSAKVTVNGEAVEYTPESCFTFSNGAITDYDVSCGGTDVVIPKTIGGSTVNSIGSKYAYAAFAEKGLISIIIPNTVTSLIGDPGDGTIWGLFAENNLTNLTIPESVTYISDAYLVYGSQSLTTIRIPESVTALNNDFMGGYSDIMLFNETNIKELVLPGSISNLGSYFFGASYGESEIEDLILMGGLNKIGTLAFSENINIQELEIPSSVMIIEENAFLNNLNLTKIIVRGKSSLSDFTDSTGLTTEGGLPEGVTIEFRP